MCRMIGITNYSYAEHKNLLEGFFGLSMRGKILKGDSRGHLDGWGIGYYKEGKAFIHKSGRPVTEEKKDYFETLRKIGSSPVLIAHLRKSSYKPPHTGKNAHPFEYKNVIFAHNGTIRDYKKLLKEMKPQDRPSPKALDSEVYAHFVISRPPAGLGQKLSSAASFIRKNNKYSSLTCLFTDGKKLYARREFTKTPDYYTLYKAKYGNSVIISSEPVLQEIKWKVVRDIRVRQKDADCGKI